MEVKDYIDYVLISLIPITNIGSCDHILSIILYQELGLLLKLLHVVMEIRAG